MYRIIHRKQIDTTAWDTCVSRDPNGDIFGLSALLDSIGTWRGLVRGDYEAVFPLIEGSKMGLPYLYQPSGLARIRIYSPQDVPEADLGEILSIIDRGYAFADIQLSGAWPTSLSGGRITLYDRCYQFIDTNNKDYDQVWGGFKSSMRNLVRKGRKEGLVVATTADVSTVADAGKNSVAASKIPKFEKQLPTIQKLTTAVVDKGFGQIWTVKHEGETVAASLVSLHRNVLYLNYIFSNDKGHRLNANHCLISEMIRNNMPGLRGFDFCGSAISSIAAFNRRFGATDRSQTRLRAGRLVKLAKRIQH